MECWAGVCGDKGIHKQAPAWEPGCRNAYSTAAEYNSVGYRDIGGLALKVAAMGKNLVLIQTSHLSFGPNILHYKQGQ